jgi:hypothetical protein
MVRGRGRERRESEGEEWRIAKGVAQRVECDRLGWERVRVGGLKTLSVVYTEA